MFLWTFTDSPYKVVWQIPKQILIVYKKYTLFEINTTRKILLFRMKYIDKGCLF